MGTTPVHMRTYMGEHVICLPVAHPRARTLQAPADLEAVVTAGFDRFECSHVYMRMHA